MSKAINITWQLPPPIVVRFPSYVQVQAPAAESTGGVSGPDASSANAVARFDGSSGGSLKNSPVILDDDGNLTGVRSITFTKDGRTVTVSVDEVNGRDDFVIL